MLSPSKQPQKRFYKSVSTAPDPNGFRIELDGRSIKTPSGAPLVLPTAVLADAVAHEWDSQSENLNWQALGLTKLANTAIDGVAPHSDEVLDDILKYAASDLICYRAESPDGLAALQAEVWDPILAWIHETYGAEFRVVTGITSVEQSYASIDQLKSSLIAVLSVETPRASFPRKRESMTTASSVSEIEMKPRFRGDDFTQTVKRPAAGVAPFKLAAIHVMTTITGSALLAFAHIAKRLTLEQFWAAATVDEEWQSQRWGKDYEAEIRNENRFRDLEVASRIVELASLGG